MLGLVAPLVDRFSPEKTRRDHEEAVEEAEAARMPDAWLPVAAAERELPTGHAPGHYHYHHQPP